tara:strand:+ start:2375 stop:2962 length:588 start_codon:yes stop_codon:yes gene_type:complete
MNTKIYFTTLLLLFTLVSCKKENTLAEYKFADKPIALPCDNLNIKLYNEALYSFENDISNFYSVDKKSLLRSYSQFLNASRFNRVDFKKMVSEHTLQVFEALKNDQDLWSLSNTTSKLNYNSPLMDCISKNMDSNHLKTTLNALLTTNSMSAKLFTPTILSNSGLVLRDKVLATYVAFDLYYANLFDIDFSETNP